MSNQIRRKVVGESYITAERVVSVNKESTSNIITVTKVIKTKSYRCIVLECGHRLSCKEFNIVPTSNTRCIECECERDNERYTLRLNKVRIHKTNVPTSTFMYTPLY